MILFGALLLAHLLYDFHWQGPFIAAEKGKHLFLLAVHALTWALLLGAVLWGFGALAWWHMPFLFTTHAATDYWKSHKPATPETFGLIYVDQTIHLATILIVVVANA